MSASSPPARAPIPAGHRLRVGTAIRYSDDEWAKLLEITPKLLPVLNIFSGRGLVLSNAAVQVKATLVNLAQSEFPGGAISVSIATKGYTLRLSAPKTLPKVLPAASIEFDFPPIALPRGGVHWVRAEVNSNDGNPVTIEPSDAPLASPPLQYSKGLTVVDFETAVSLAAEMAGRE